MRKWGPAIQTSLWALQLAVKVGSVCAGVPLPKLPLSNGLSIIDTLAFLSNVSVSYMLLLHLELCMYTPSCTVNILCSRLHSTSSI
jgi:hypothetical protein